MGLYSDENKLENNLQWYLPISFLLIAAVSFSVYLILLRTVFIISTPLPKITYLFIVIIAGVTTVLIFLDCRKLRNGKDISLGKEFIKKIAIAVTIAAGTLYAIVLYTKSTTLFEFLNIRIMILVFLIAFSMSIASFVFSIITKPLYRKEFRKEYYLPMSYSFIPTAMSAAIFALAIVGGIHYRAEVNFDNEYYSLRQVEKTTSVYQNINFDMLNLINISENIGRVINFYPTVYDNSSINAYESVIGRYLYTTYSDNKYIYGYSIYLDNARSINPELTYNGNMYTTWKFNNTNYVITSTNISIPISDDIYNRMSEKKKSVLSMPSYNDTNFYIYNPILVNDNLRGFVALNVSKVVLDNIFNSLYSNTSITTLILDENYNIKYSSDPNTVAYFQDNLNNNLYWNTIKTNDYQNNINATEQLKVIDITRDNYQATKYLLNGDMIVLNLWSTSANDVARNFVFRRTIISATIIIMSSIVALFFVLYMLLQSIRKTIVGAREVSGTLSKGAGDLTTRLPITSNNETGDLVHSFNNFLDKMQNIIINVKNNAYTLTGNVQNMRASISVSLSDFKSIYQEFENELEVSNRISKSSANAARVSFMQRTRFTAVNETIQSLLDNINVISDRMNAQSEAVSKTSSSVQQMMANIVTVGHGANKANVHAQNLYSEAQDGSAVGESVMESIQSIKEYSKQITNITQVIHNIAEQTNLLAMNAAIEAAHAGEQGRGFTVVADKIRKLAEDTGENSKIINEIIEETTDAIDHTVSLAFKSSESIERIVEGTSTLAELISTISSANDELDIGRREILGNIKNLNSITETVQELSSKQRQMSSTVSQNISNVDKLAEDVVKVVNNTEREMKGLVDSIQVVSGLADTSSDNMETLEKRIKELQYIFLQLYKLVTLFKTERTQEDMAQYERNMIVDKERLKLERKAEKERIKEEKRREKEAKKARKQNK